METIENWRTYATVCRLCMQNDGYMLGIFNHIRGKDKSIYKKIVDCIGLEISSGDGLPNVICHRCLYKLEFGLEFRKLCFLSDATLKQLINNTNTKNNENSELNSTYPQLPIYEKLANGTGEDVVMVVDPYAYDYESEYETENERHNNSDNENLDANASTFGGRSVSMCKYCDYAFIDALQCIEHENTAHNRDVPYTCTLCDMNFGDRLQFSAHLKGVHQNDKPFNCPQCERTFARRSDLRKHTVVHTGIKPYTCTICSKSFSRNTNLSKHMRIHSGRKPFVCLKCPKTFFSKGDLTRHAIIHSGQKPFNCNYCHLSFGRKDKLLRHEKRHFPQQSDEQKSQDILQLQQQQEQANEQDLVNNDLALNNYNYYDNNINEKSTNNQNNLGDKSNSDSENMVISIDPFNHNNYSDNINKNDQINSYESELLNSSHDSLEIDRGREKDENYDSLFKKPFPPNPTQHITGDYYSKNNKNNYNEGIDNLDTDQQADSRPYICNICKKRFIRKRELDRHFATHTGMKPFKCTKCNKSFGRKDKLVRHMRIHDENKEHVCNICGASFNRRDGLIHHSKTHEKIDEFQ